MSESIRAAYNRAAPAYRKKYDSSGARQSDVDLALSFMSAKKPRVFEIGCAHGRDARYILTKTPHYTGIDISDAFIAMAQAELPHGHFEQADITAYEFTASYDLVIAFASLLHLNKTEMGAVLKKIHKTLRPHGILFLSLKRGDHYYEADDDDGATVRRFCYYTRADIEELSAGLFQTMNYNEQERGIPWFTIILQKC